MSSSSDDILAGFGPNERAMLSRVPTRPLRRLAAAVVRRKERLQFTGWLQYLVPLGPALGIALLAGLVWLLGFGRVAGGLGLLFGALSLRVAYDLLTCRFGWRPKEPRPPRRDAADVFTLMRERRSCRSFQRRNLSDEDREALLASARRHLAAPTLGPTPIRLEYIQAPLTVWPAVNCREFFVAIVPKPYDRSAVIDVGRALQRVVIDATRAGLGTCWIGPGADHVSLKAHLGERFNEDEAQIICVCAVGYPSRFAPLFIQVFSRLMRSRLPLDQLFFSDAALTQPIDPEAPPYSTFKGCLQACQWGPSSYNGQTTRAALRCDDQGRLQRVDFYASTASRYYAPVALGIWCANWELGAEALGRSGRFERCPPPSEAQEPPYHDVRWTPTEAVSSG